MSTRERARKRPRHRGAQGRANADLAAHIQSLGLESVEAYRAWCREQGFTGALTKDWQQRRRERAAMQLLKVQAVREESLAAHLERLRLPDVPAYRAWCRAQGISDSLNKSDSQRRRELETGDRLRAEAALGSARRTTRNLADTIRDLAAGRLSDGELRGELLSQVARAFAGAGDGGVRKALRRLLLLAESRSRLLNTHAAIPRFAGQPGSSYLDGLLALARRHDQWLRDPEEWTTDTHNLRRQYGSLARHLLCRYPVPSFMDAAWFHPDPAAAERQQDWFIHVGTGGNIRRADLPLALTSRMAHHFLLAPADLTVEEALRWAQVVGMGGTPHLARTVVATRLGSSFGDEEFWETVVRFLVNNPMLDPAQVGPIADFIHHVRFVPQELPGEGGETVLGPPPRPDFAMKGRTVAALLKLVEEWHRQLARAGRLPGHQWPPSGIGGYQCEEERRGEPVVWTIRELLSGRELQVEGRAMSHCVASYSQSCYRGATSVWSLQVSDPRTGETRRVMTIAVKNGSRSVSEARGKRNALPTTGDTHGSAKRLSRQDQELLREGRRILARWVEQEGLKCSR